MAKKIKVNNSEEFNQLLKDKDLRISKGIVKAILENLIGKRKNIHVLEIYLKDEDSIIDITVHRDDFVQTLEENMKNFIYHEEYEACSGIQKAIKYLKGE
jgi:hypothetical protein